MRKPLLTSLAGANSPQSARAALLSRYQAFDPGALTEVAIIGAAEEGRRLAALCANHGIAVRAVADDDPAKRGLFVGSLPVTPVDALSSMDRQMPIVVASHRVLAISTRLREMGFGNVAPFALFQLLDPERFPPHMFYRDLIEDLVGNRRQYDALADRLADDESRSVLDAVIGYRLSLDARVLRPVIDSNLYAPTRVLTFDDDEVYVDAGSFDGDSVRWFIERVQGRFRRVLAFEPDRVTFQRLAANFSHDDRVEPVNAGLHECPGFLKFDATSSRSASIAAEGRDEIRVESLDNFLSGERVTFIKMNIEGAELSALQGAAETIRRWRPKLAISAYHRSSDLWNVPALVTKLYEGYRLYLRQHDGGIVETVLYATA
jgi:FkbM family methyltransferase